MFENEMNRSFSVSYINRTGCHQVAVFKVKRIALVCIYGMEDYLGIIVLSTPRIPGVVSQNINTSGFGPVDTLYVKGAVGLFGAYNVLGQSLVLGEDIETDVVAFLKIHNGGFGVIVYGCCYSYQPGSFLWNLPAAGDCRKCNHRHKQAKCVYEFHFQSFNLIVLNASYCVSELFPMGYVLYVSILGVKIVNST